MSTRDWIQCFGWVAFHFLWLACLVAGALWLANGLLRPASPRSRYACAWLALLLCAAMPVVTFCRFAHAIDPVDRQVRTMEVKAPWLDWGVVTLRFEDHFIPIVGVRLDKGAMEVTAVICSLAAVLWLTGSASLLARSRLGWLVMTQRRHAVQEAPEATASMLAEVAGALGMKRVPPCMQRARIHTPEVVGVLRPRVVVPSDFGAAFTTAQQRMLLAHELVHIVRGDSWRNAMQCVIEMFLFWHPAVLWISQRVRHERELCCDERAAMLLAEAPALAHALALLAEDAALRPCRRLAANRGSLLERARLLGSAQFPRPLYRWRLACAMALMPLTLLGAMHSHVSLPFD